jgi:hypothetical protein
MAGRKVIMYLDLTKKEADTIVAGLKAALDFAVNYYTFAPSPDGDYNNGDIRKCSEREAVARRIIERVELRLVERG